MVNYVGLKPSAVMTMGNMTSLRNGSVFCFPPLPSRAVPTPSSALQSGATQKSQLMKQKGSDPVQSPERVEISHTWAPVQAIGDVFNLSVAE